MASRTYVSGWWSAFPKRPLSKGLRLLELSYASRPSFLLGISGVLGYCCLKLRRSFLGVEFLRALFSELELPRILLFVEKASVAVLIVLLLGKYFKAVYDLFHFCFLGLQKAIEYGLLYIPLLRLQHHQRPEHKGVVALAEVEVVPNVHILQEPRVVENLEQVVDSVLVEYDPLPEALGVLGESIHTMLPLGDHVYHVYGKFA